MQKKIQGKGGWAWLWIAVKLRIKGHAELPSAACEPCLVIFTGREQEGAKLTNNGVYAKRDGRRSKNEKKGRR